jgi:hypothetical protein
VGYKFAQANESVQILGGTGDIDHAGAIAIHVWRGISSSDPVNGVATTNLVINTAIPNPPNLSGISDGALVIVAGAGGHNQSTGNDFTSSSLDNFISDSGNDTHDVTIGMGSIVFDLNTYPSGSYDPDPFSWSGSDSTAFTTVATTISINRETLSLTTREESIPVLQDNLEVFSGWTDISTNTFTQSSTRAFNGAYSGLRDLAGHNIGGAVKLLSEPISRPYRMEYRIWTDDSIRTGLIDRVGILNSSLQGYGTRVAPAALGPERYDGVGYNSSAIGSTSFSKPQLQWYKAVFEANADDTFTTAVYEEDGTLVATNTSVADTNYTGTFDRVYVGGGYPYYIDDVSIYGTATKPLNKKNSGIWSLSAALESIDLTPQIFPGNVHPSPTDIYSWVTSATRATISRDAMTSPLGSTPLKMDVAGNDPYTNSYGSSTWNLAAATTGETWQVRVFAKASVATTIELFMFGANSLGNWAGDGGNLKAEGFSVGTGWSEFIMDYTFTSTNVSFVQVRLDGPNSGGAGQTVWFDGLQVRKIS